MMSACGVLCSQCPAYIARAKGRRYQERTAAAWRSIYQLDEKPENISCGGCLGTDDQLFHTSRKCAARRCCLSNRFSSCADCPKETCADLETAQAVWDGVPALAGTLSRAAFDAYAQPYCGHRQRLEKARRQRIPLTPPN